MPGASAIRMGILAKAVAQMPSLEAAWPAVIALDTDSPAAVCVTAVSTVFDELDRTASVGELVPGVNTARLGGGRPAVINELLSGDLAATWKTLTSRRLDELLEMPNMGRRRVIRFLAAMVLVASEHDLRATVERAVHLIGAQ